MARSQFNPNDADLSHIDPARLACVHARRVIVKVGTSVVTRPRDQRLSIGRLGALVESLEALVRSGRQVILVTSGATAVGRQKLRFQQVLNYSPLEMQILGLSPLQARAAAAAGQSGLMALYDSLFQMMDMQCSQFLVTSRDFRNEDFQRNLVLTVDSLLQMNVVPVINENDSISSPDVEGDSCAFTDNDGLASKLTHLLGAELLILMTDVDGVFTGPPKEPESKLIDVWCPAVHEGIVRMGEKSAVGRGGMGSKIASAWFAAQSGATTVVMNGKYPENVVRIILGEKVGTLFNVNLAEAMAIRASEAEPHARPVDADSRAGPAAAARRARVAGRALAALPSQERSAILHRIADSLEANVGEILEANAGDVQSATGVIDNHLLQRLILKESKLAQLAAGIRQLADLDEPIGRILSRTQIAEGLELSKVTSPIGVVLIIFEARPDALPQIASLAIRTGNALLLKGGKEAARSNACLHALIAAALRPSVSPDAVSLVTSRGEIDELLRLKGDIDLVVPRGSNSLVSYIQSHTSIPVLGHADGICHIYVDVDVDLEEACRICVDSKTDYPAACNAVEKILVHASHASGVGNSDGIFRLQAALREAGVSVYGTPATMALLGVPEAPALRHEYGTPEVTVDVVADVDEAIEKIHAHGSGHTEVICTRSEAAAEDFLRRVDSACVFTNCSSRFSDGFRFGLGAEVGISTSRIHARGPVGVEGLLTTRYLLRGHGQVVAKDTGVSYTHVALPVTGGDASSGSNGAA